MTHQRHDFLIVDNEPRRIAAAAPVPFAPNAFGLRFGGMLATNCYRGFWVEFVLDGDAFKIKELQLSTHPEDREEVLRGKLFDREPDDATEFSVTFRDVFLPYTGRLIVDQFRKLAIAPKNKKEIFCFTDGSLDHREKVELQELPEDFTPSSVWVDYGVMLWIPLDPSELENT